MIRIIIKERFGNDALLQNDIVKVFFIYIFPLKYSTRIWRAEATKEVATQRLNLQVCY